MMLIEFFLRVSMDCATITKCNRENTCAQFDKGTSEEERTWHEHFQPKMLNSWFGRIKSLKNQLTNNRSYAEHQKKDSISIANSLFSRNVFASLFADELLWANQRKERKKGTPIIVWLPAYKRGFAPVETQILFSYYWQNSLIGFPAYCLLICLATCTPLADAWDRECVMPLPSPMM